MKPLQKAPTFQEMLAKLPSERISEAIGQSIEPVDPKGRYLHWEEIQHRKAPNGISTDQWWLATKLARRSLYRPLPLKDEYGRPFVFGTPDIVHRRLHWIDRQASGQILAKEPILNSEHRDEYLVNSLIEEAIRSSQLEGAATTRAVAKKMLKEGRRPKDKSERMILNNFRVMQSIRDYVNESLTIDLIFELHRIVSSETLDDPAMAGRFRRDSDDIHVVDQTGRHVLHVPPSANSLPGRIESLCEFANESHEESIQFIHPLIKAILLHFAIGYEHPFVDGNGRTARALFYWYALKTGYWLLEFVSISRILQQARSKYDLAYLMTETDDNDTTYFIIHQLGVIENGIRSLLGYLERKTVELEEAKRWLSTGKWKGALNHRQLSLIRNALRHPNSEYTFATHSTSHGCVYQTARTDLLQLEKEGLLIRSKKPEGKGYVFRPVPNLKNMLKKTNK